MIPVSYFTISKERFPILVMAKIIYARNVDRDIRSLENIAMRTNVSSIFNSNQQFLDGKILALKLKSNFASFMKYCICGINPTVISYFD